MAAKPPAVIDKGIEIRGELSGEGDLSFAGRIEGRIVTAAKLTIEPDAVVEADLEAASLLIHGRVTGRVAASEEIALSGSAVVIGDVEAPRVRIEEGARIRGRVEMNVELPEELGRVP